MLLFEAPRLRPDLCAALRIQLTDSAEVRCRDDVSGTLPERLARAAEAVARDEARLGVLLERDADPALVRMYLVSDRPNEAVIAIERIEDRPAPDVDRSLALTVREAVDVLVATPPALATEAPLAPVLMQAHAPAVRGERRVSVLLEGGGALSWGRQRRSIGLLSGGVRLTRRALALELAVSARMSSAVRVRGAPGLVDEDEWGLGASVRGNVTRGRLTVGLLAGAGSDRVRARGVTQSGVPGSAALFLPRFDLGLDLRLRLFASASLRIAPTLELFPVAQRFALDERVVISLGRRRVLLPLSLSIELPLR